MTADLALQSLLPCTVLALMLPAPAQRDEVTLPGQKPGKVTVTYGVVNLGTHGLHELAVGSTWRMGQGNPSTLVTELPLLAGDNPLPPGGYGVNIYRAGETDLRLNIGGGAGAGVQFPGELSEPKKKTKKLQLTWLKSPPRKKGEAADASARKSAGLKTCCLRVDFGRHRLDIPVTVVGAESHRVRGFTALSYTFPLKFLKDRLATKETPLLSLIPRKVKRGEAPGFNVMVGETVVELVPMSKAPENFGRRGGRGGRGGRREREAAAEPEKVHGTVKWEAAQEKVDHVTIKGVTLGKKELSFEIYLDDRIGKVKVGLLVPKKKK
jgi:hypothetical protein